MSTATALANTRQTYGAVAKTFHWLTALLILTAIPLGLIANDWPLDSSEALATKFWLFSLHKTVGVTAFFVALLRILWALSQPKPGLLHPDRKLESWLAETVHWMLYASLVLVPLSGWLHHSATSGFAPIWWPFGQSLPFVPMDESVAKFFAAWHWLFTKVLIAALLLHVAGALKHHFVDRDLTLKRMLPGRNAAEGAAPGHARAPILAAVGLWAAVMAVGSVLGLSGGSTQAAQAPPLPAETTATAATGPASWTVQEGTLGIVVVQNGAPLEGSFADWSAAITFDPDAPAEDMGEVSVEIAVPSLTLGSVTQQALGAEFFAANTHPTAVFDATISAAPDQAEQPYLAEGTLRLKGVEVPVSLPFTLQIEGDTATMFGTTTLDRRNYEIGTAQYNDEQTVGFEVTVDVDLVARRSE